MIRGRAMFRAEPGKFLLVDAAASCSIAQYKTQTPPGAT